MTSPIPPQDPEIGKPERHALSPATKIFAASTTLLIGTAVAVTFWKTSLDYVENPLIDRLLVSAPLPGDTVTPTTNVKTETISKPTESDEGNLVSIPLPALEVGPAMDSGNAKYAQAYPPPILVSDGEKRQKKESRPGQAEKERKFLSVSAEFNRVHKITGTPPKTERPNADFAKRPASVSTIEMSDALLPFFHEAENLKPLGPAQDGKREPENPFSEPIEMDAVMAEKKGNADLKPLPPVLSVRNSHTELKPLPKP